MSLLARIMYAPVSESRRVSACCTSNDCSMFQALGNPWYWSVASGVPKIDPVGSRRDMSISQTPAVGNGAPPQLITDFTDPSGLYVNVRPPCAMLSPLPSIQG